MQSYLSDVGCHIYIVIHAFVLAPIDRHDAGATNIKTISMHTVEVDMNLVYESEYVKCGLIFQESLRMTVISIYLEQYT